LAFGAEALSLFSPLEAVLDQLLVIQREEGGVPPRHFSLDALDDAIATAESFSVLHQDTDLHTDVGGVSHLRMVIFLAKNVLVQAATLADEVEPRGEGEPEHPVVSSLRQLVVDLEGLQSRRVVTAGSFMEVVRESSGGSSSEKDDSHALDELMERMMETTAITEKVLEGDDLVREGSRVLMDLSSVKEEMGRLINGWAGGSLRSLDARDVWTVVSPQREEGRSGVVTTTTPCTVRARRMRKRLVDAVDVQPLLEATKESEKKLAQVREKRGGEKEKEKRDSSFIFLSSMRTSS